MLRKVAEGLAHSRKHHRRSGAHQFGIRSQVLRDLLLQPPAPGSDEVFAGLGLSLAPPFHPCALWIRDFEVVAGRFHGEGLSRFAEMVERSLAQVLARRGGGEVVMVRPDHAVALPAAGGACEDAAGT
jgi:hypothetical protein